MLTSTDYSDHRVVVAELAKLPAVFMHVTEARQEIRCILSRLHTVGIVQ
jgi:hypothetical protein